MKISEFVEQFKQKNIQNSKVAPNAISEYIRKTIEIKTYIPFATKKVIAEEIVKQNTTIVDGVKKNDSIDQYICFIISAIVTHTNLETDDDVIADYDLLAESKLLSYLIAEFKESYDELDTLLKMALASELEYNNLSNVANRFWGGILDIINGIVDTVSTKVNDFTQEDILKGVSPEDLSRLQGMLQILSK